MVEPVELGCLGTIVGLNAIGFFTDAIPMQVNMTLQALSMIILGANRSVIELIMEFKKIHVDKKGSKDGEGIETMSKDDVKWFPIQAGGTLLGLYGFIQFFGKEVLNPILLTYMGVGASQVIKSFMLSLNVPTFEKLEEKKLFHLKIGFLELDHMVTMMDIVGLAISGVLVAIYIISKSWIFNNLLATLLSINAIQMIFLGNFKNGFMMLIALFFYDIFFVFGTDVMLTVAKSIDAPIKILFPTDWSADPPKFSLLGLGDIVIPGIFMAMCLRYDVLRSLNVKAVNRLSDEGNADEVVQMLRKARVKAPRPYFYGCVIGYIIAIITTVVIMIVFEHGQPALLYLVPACLGATLINALRLGELKTIWEFTEENFVDDPKEEEEESDGKDADGDSDDDAPVPVKTEKAD